MTLKFTVHCFDGDNDICSNNEIVNTYLLHLADIYMLPQCLICGVVIQYLTFFQFFFEVVEVVEVEEVAEAVEVEVSMAQPSKGILNRLTP